MKAVIIAFAPKNNYGTLNLTLSMSDMYINICGYILGIKKCFVPYYPTLPSFFANPTEK